MSIPLVIALFCAFDLLVVTLVVLAVVRTGWGPLARRYAAREISPQALRRNFQSFRLGAINLGGAVHVAVDEQHLHMIPVRVLRWLGARPLSVPWSSIAITRRSRSGRWITASFDGLAVTGPAWCLELAG